MRSNLMTSHLMKAWLLLAIYAVSRIAAEADENLSDYLWRESDKLHADALNSFFIQGLKTISLDPTDFGSYMVQDAIYLYLSKTSIDTAANRTIDPDLKQFLKQKAESYESLYIDLFNEWHIKDTSGITLGNACSNYVNHLNDVANTLEPIYLVAALIPCVKLWPWIGEQIHADLGNFGVYTKWVQEEFDPSYKGYELYEYMINNAFKEGTIEKDQALRVYQESMKGEVAFFTFL